MRRGTRILPKLGLLVAALALALAVEISLATPLHSEPGDQIAVQEANFSEPVAVERPVVVAKGFENAEPPNIRPEPAVPPELRNQKPDPPKTATPSAPELEKAAQRKEEREQAKRRRDEQQRLERQRAERQEAKRQKAEQRELERQEAKRRKRSVRKRSVRKRSVRKRNVGRPNAGRLSGERRRPSARRLGHLRPGECCRSRLRRRGRHGLRSRGRIPLAVSPEYGVRCSRGGKMSLSIKEIGLRNSEIETTDEQRALDRGLIHLPQTSRPWEQGKARNVYVVGHRMGWPDTGSWKIFYRLDELQRNDRLVLTADGETYRYRVTEKFVVTPWDVWVTDPVKGRDLLTLQTCTGPNFSQRLIIRADRV